MDDEERRIRRAGLVAGRLDDQAVHLGAVLALRLEVLGRSRAAARCRSGPLWCVSRRSAPFSSAYTSGGVRRRRHQHGEAGRPCRGSARAPTVALSRDRRTARSSIPRPGTRATFCVRSSCEQERQALAVGRPRHARHGAIERRHQDRRRGGRTGRRRRVRRDDHQLVHVVGAVLVDVAEQHREPRAVGAPHRTAALALGRARELPRRRAGARLDRPDVGVGRAIGIGVRRACSETRSACRRATTTATASSTCPLVSTVCVRAATSNTAMCS